MNDVKCVLVTTTFCDRSSNLCSYDLFTWDPENIMMIGVNDKRHFKKTIELVSNHKPVFSPLLICNPYELSELKHVVSQANKLIMLKNLSHEV